MKLRAQNEGLRSELRSLAVKLETFTKKETEKRLLEKRMERGGINAPNVNMMKLPTRELQVEELSADPEVKRK